MLNFFSSNKSIIDSQTLQQLLDEALTPSLEQMGLIKAANYCWNDQALQTIRHGFSYSHLKGASGTFTWGANLDFLPIVHKGKIEYHKTAKKYVHHLFEWTDEYSNSFFGGQLRNGVTTHFGLKEAKKSIVTIFEKYQPEIKKWFDTTTTIESLIDKAERQVAIGKYYDIHSPSPKYVLAFLYAKANRIDTAIALFDRLELYHFDNDEKAKEKVKAKLLALTEKNGM